MYLREKFDQTLPAMPGAVSVDVTRAAQWYLRDDERLVYRWEDFPSLVPPYPDVWMEFTFPRQVRSDGGQLVDLPPFLHASAVLLHTSEIDPVRAAAIRGRHYPFLGAALQALAPGSRLARIDDDEDSDTPPRWLVHGQTVLASQRQVQAVNLWAMTLDEQGRFIRHTTLPLPWGYVALSQGSTAAAAQALYLAQPPEAQAAWSADVRDQFEPPFLFCLALLHCRNVQVVDKPAPPAAVLKQRARQGRPYFHYKLLDVLPLRATGAGASASGRRDQPLPGEPPGLHFVRGHFKDFSAKGLFGKYKGIYWWDSQVRGSSAQGVIDKDYRLTPA